MVVKPLAEGIDAHFDESVELGEPSGLKSIGL
jgi:hypothetical protein